MKIIFLGAIAFSLLSCGAQQPTMIEDVNPMSYAESITSKELKENLYIFASNAFERRENGEPGQKKAAEYLKTEY